MMNSHCMMWGWDKLQIGGDKTQKERERAARWVVPVLATFQLESFGALATRRH